MSAPEATGSNQVQPAQGLTEFDPWVTSWEAAAMPSNGINRSAGAFEAWRAAQHILEHREAIETQGAATLHAVSLVLRHGLKPPQWLVAAFECRWEKFSSLEAKSLDEAFGHSPPNDRTAQMIKKRAKLVPAINAALCAAIRAAPSRPIDQGLFTEVADRFGIGKTDCEEIYRLSVRVYGLLDVVLLKEALATAPAESEKSPGLQSGS